MRAFCMLTKVPSTLSTPVGMPRSIPTLYACRARVPAPVPMIILWRPRFSTISSIRGKTAARPRSIKLCPPILITFASGRIWMSELSSVRARSSWSVRFPVTSDCPSLVSSSFCIDTSEDMELIWRSRCSHVDRLEFEELFLIQQRFQVPIALLGPGTKPTEHALLHLLWNVVAGEPLLLLPRREPVERGLSARPACDNAGLRARPANRLQRREEYLDVSVVAPAAVAFLFEELPHLAAECGLHRIARSAHHAEDEPAPFGTDHTPGFGGCMVHVDVMERTRREDRRYASVLGGPAIVSVGHEGLSVEPGLLHLLTEDREHRRRAVEADIVERSPDEG